MRFAEAFIGDGRQGIADFYVSEILVPAAKELFADTTKKILDSVKEGIDRMLLGDDVSPGRSSSGVRRGGSGHVPYNRIHPSSSRDRDESRRPHQRQQRADSAYRHIFFEAKVDADEALAEMEDVLARYESVSINDFYDHVEMDRDTTVENLGWFDLSDARVKRIREGWIVDFPRHEPLN